MEIQNLEIPPIVLKWTRWYSWEQIASASTSKNEVEISSGPGVYEVANSRSKRRLTIGKSVNLNARIRNQLVLGRGKHSTGKRIRASEDASRLRVRWAETDRPCAAEEELHIHYRERYKCLPLYTKHT